MRIYLFLYLFLTPILLQAQTGCPGCITDLPQLPADTIFVEDIPDGQAGAAYDQDISFRMPMTTTPVNAVDPSTPAGLTITDLEIVSITGLPPGINWQASQTVFQPSQETDGCLKFCGQPLEPGLYMVEVELKATIIIISQTTSFFLEMYIAPAGAGNAGFSMTNNVGCGPLTVSFQNENPSNGQAGYSYFWDFGNGLLSAQENPADQVYEQPGTYQVSYTALIDTFGSFLNTVTVEEAGCGDLLFGRPDLFINLLDANDSLLYTSAVISNADLPVSFSPSYPLEAGPYQLEVIDKDGGLDGADDLCGVIVFEADSSGTYIDGELEVNLQINQPVTTLNAVGEIQVFPRPAPPLLASTTGETDFCLNDSLLLEADSLLNNRWFFEGALINDSASDSLWVNIPGLYGLQYETDNGCRSEISELLVEGILPPTEPNFVQDGNLLFLEAEVDLPSGEYVLQWYLDGALLDGETEETLCLEESGEYSLELTDLLTGCTNVYTAAAPYDPDEDCLLTSVEGVTQANYLLYPNPARDWMQIEAEQRLEQVRIFDFTGRPVLNRFLESNQARINLSGLPAGAYVVELWLERKKVVRDKMIIR